MHLFFVLLGQRELANTHNAGREFESRPHRKEAIRKGCFFLLQYSVWILESDVRKPNKKIAIDCKCVNGDFLSS